MPEVATLPKGPLFSTYRQGENRVTASLMAVFERIDLSKVERILAVASEDSALQLFAFQNQVRGHGSTSVPDARISASFSLWFETKTVPHAVTGRQVRDHVGHLGSGGTYERLFVVTPDIDEPPAIAQVGDSRVRWISFRALSQAIDDLLGDDRELVSELERLLLRELQALFEVDGLLGDPRQVLVVPAASAYGHYLQLSAYMCQPGRPFKPVERLAFYCRGKIEREVPRIRHIADHVAFTDETVATLRASGGTLDAELADLVERAVLAAVRPAGALEKVFLLTPPGDPETMTLDQPIVNDTIDQNGRPTAWVMMQRYTSLAALQRARVTSGLTDSPIR